METYNQGTIIIDVGVVVTSLSVDSDLSITPTFSGKEITLVVTGGTELNEYLATITYNTTETLEIAIYVSQHCTLSYYGSVVEADRYFAKRLNTLDWDDATNNEKLLSVLAATELVEQFNYTGKKYVSTQELEFPRDTNGIPEPIKVAVYLIAQKIVGGWDIDDDANANRVLSSRYDVIHAVYRDVSLEHAGIPSKMAWYILKQYLHKQDQVRIQKCS